MTSKKFTTMPKNIDDMSIEEIQQYIENTNKRQKKLIIELINKQAELLKKQKEEIEKQKESIKDALSGLIPDFEYFDEKDQDTHIQKDAENWVENLTEKQVEHIIQKTNNYDKKKSSYRMNAFFHRHADRIFKSKIGCIVKIKTVNLRGEVINKQYTVKPSLIKMLIDFYREGKQELDKNSVGSDVQIEYELSWAFEIEFIEPPKEEDKKKSNRKQKRVGAYFNYINKIPEIDLSKQQIGHNYNEHIQLSKEQCFLYSLQQAGIHDVDFIKSQINCDNVDLLSMKNIKNIKGLITNFSVQVLKEGESVKTQKIIYDDTFIDSITLGLFKDHFFYNQETHISPLWIKNYEQYKDNQNFLNTQNLKEIKIKNNRPIFMRSNDKRPIGLIIKLMYELGYFEEIKELNIHNFKHSKDDIVIPQNVQQYQKIEQTIQEDIEERVPTEPVGQEEEKDEDEEKQQRKKREFDHARQAQPDQIYFGDFETFTSNDNGDFIQHEPFLLCFCDKEGNMYNGRNFQSFINHIKQTEYKNVLMYFHNLSYDSSFILDQPNLTIESILDPNNRIVQFVGKCENIKITFRDSLRVISSPLKNMPKMFLSKEEQKNIFKEVFPYNYYTKSRYIKKTGNINDAYEHIQDATKQEFIESIKKGQAYIDEDHFNMQQYAKYYCEQDVIVLQKCFMKFADMLKQEFDMNLFESLSISSISLKYQIQKGCFDGCTKVSGVLRQYLQQFVKGGRVQCAENKKIKVQGQKISDFDAVSLYPSAQKRVYYPQGFCQILTPDQIKYYNNPNNLFKITEDKDSIDQNSLFLSVKLDSKNIIKRKMMLLSHKDDNGIRQFVNDCDDNKIYYLSHIILQDLVKFQGYKYQIIEGVYFKERNYKINEVIKYMFEKRKQYKAQKNPIQEIYKLMMNSSYGKTCENVHDTQTKIIGKNKYLQYVFNNFNVINEIIEVGNQENVEKYIIKESVEIIDQSAYNYIGVMILDQSKRLMNEVCCLAEDLGIDIYYTDTDSMHIEQDKLDILAIEYQKIYHRQLVGKDQGQFHTDFSSDKGEVLYADQSIFLGKKCYCDRLVIKEPNENGENGVYDFHIRMKGINSESIKIMADELYNGDVMKIYERLYDGEEIEFDLVKGSKVIMKKNKELGYVNLNEFKRVLSF